MLFAFFGSSVLTVFMSPLPLGGVRGIMFLCRPSVRASAVRASVRDVVSTISMVCIDGLLPKLLSHLGTRMT